LHYITPTYIYRYTYIKPSNCNSFKVKSVNQNSLQRMFLLVAQEVDSNRVCSCSILHRWKIFPPKNVTLLP